MQDPSGIRAVYDLWPDLAHREHQARPPSMYDEDIDHVVFAGMGGSGSLGDFLAALMSGLDIHVSVVKGYKLPRTADDRTLVVCASVSGNTAETLTILKKAAPMCHTLSFSSGGVLKSYCMDNSLPHHTIRAVHSPRASFVSFLYGMLGALQGFAGVSDADIHQSIRMMRQTGKVVRDPAGPAAALAGWLTGIPVVYYPRGFEAAAVRFKNSLQENAKTHATVEDVLEASHNSIVAWEVPSDAQPILIQGPDDDPRTKDRWRVFQEYFETKSIPYQVVRACDGHILGKLVNLVYMLDYTTIYRAGILDIDPTPVSSIRFIKERIRYD